MAHLTLGASSVDSDVIALDGASTALAIADGGGAGGDGGSAPGFLLFPQLAQFADGRLGLAAYRTAGEGTGAALGISLAEAACKILGEMATFGEAGVSEKQ